MVVSPGTAEQGPEAECRQVLTVADGLIADILGYDDRRVALMAAGLATSN